MKKCYCNFENVESSFWRAENMKYMSLWAVFQIKCDVTSGKGAECQLCASTTNTWKCRWSNRICPRKENESLTMRLLTYWEFYLGLFTPLWKTICKCIKPPPNPCPSPVHPVFYDFLPQNHTTIIPCPPYSWYSTKTGLKARRFNDITMLQAKLWVEVAKFQIFHFTVGGTVSV
jgi:hypothetical protein